MLITIDGTETPEQLRALSDAIAALAWAELPTVEPAPNAEEQPAGPSVEPESDPGALVERDLHGVAKNPEFVGDAAEPFYSSGPRSGQWKKKRGVSDEDYDNWYQSQRTDVPEPAPQDDETLDTSAAFGAPAASPEPVAPVAPRTTGEFMGWVAEQQAAQRITQAQIQAAYEQTGLSITDLFPPNDADVIADRLGRLFTALQ